jgi:hypothetical protein
MKVFNLSCSNEHTFEGWFGSADDYDSQLAGGLLECPVCGDRAVRKMPAAPRLNLSSGERPRAPDQAAANAQLQGLWLKMAAFIRDNTEDVGERFAAEARRIHHQEAPERGIRGVASPDEAAALADEGIEVMSFPMPKLPSGPMQ